jgi:hypothetical protein
MFQRQTSAASFVTSPHHVQYVLYACLMIDRYSPKISVGIVSDLVRHGGLLTGLGIHFAQWSNSHVRTHDVLQRTSPLNQVERPSPCHQARVKLNEDGLETDSNCVISMSLLRPSKYRRAHAQTVPHTQHVRRPFEFHSAVYDYFGPSSHTTKAASRSQVVEAYACQPT